MGFLSDILDPGGLFHDSDPTGQEADARESVEDARQANELKRAQFNQLRDDSQPLRELRNNNISRLLNLQGIAPRTSQPIQSNNASQLVNLGNGRWGFNAGVGEIRIPMGEEGWDDYIAAARKQPAQPQQTGETTYEFKGADQSEFYGSPEFETVRDAALRVQGTNPSMNRELAERANELATGEFGNFHNRIFNTAGFSSDGLSNTNRLLQDNIDSQVNLLNNAGAQAAGNLIAGANSRGNLASAGAGLLGTFLCDARLKKNARKVGEYHSGLGKYQWEWTDEAKKLVGNQPEEGPMAHEVLEVMPENVTTRDGYLAVKDMRLVNGY